MGQVSRVTKADTAYGAGAEQAPEHGLLQGV